MSDTALHRAVICGVVLLTLYAAALRADVLVARYGPLGGPAWVRLVDRVAAPVGAHLRPRAVAWRKDPTPYIGGDPINYIRFAREMQSFYQAHPREPMFLSLTRGFLWLTGGLDVAVSFASALSSVLVVPATYLLGSAAFGPVVGLASAAAWAIEFDTINWGVDGWRDDTFALVFTLTAWSFVRLRQKATPARAGVAGLLAAAACLTRLTSLTFIVPGLVWVAIQPAAGPRRQGLRFVGAAALIGALLTAPYLFNCWRVTGDPLYPVNYYTRYYRSAQGLSPDVEESAVAFVTRQLRVKPFGTLDTAAGGLLSWPFVLKWRGFNPWSPLLGSMLRWSAIGGLILMLWSADGRLLLVLLFSSLAPYTLTWTLGGGGAWRFTEHLYPIYLVAAFSLWKGAIQAATALRRRPTDWRGVLTRRRLAEVGLVGCAIVVALALYWSLPPFVTREALAVSEPTTMVASSRGAWFFVGSWSAPQTTGAGNVTIRTAERPHVGMRFLLPHPMSAWLTIRADPAETANLERQPSLTVFLNKQKLGDLRLTRTPGRMGMYRFPVTASQTRAGVNQLDLLASHTVPASEAGPQFAWLAADTPVAFRLWYLRIEPSE